MGPHVITISYAKRTLTQGSRERLRMREYASVLASFHVIVFTRANEALPAIQEEGNLFLYGTNACTKVGMIMRAFTIARDILRKHPETHFVVSGQDPFESSLVTLLLSLYRNAHLHVQIHGDVFNSRFFNNSLVTLIKWSFADIVLKRAKKVRVVSERIKVSLIKRGVTEKKIVVVPVQTSLDEFLAVGRERSYEHKTPIRCVFVGRFSEEKNIPLLLRAFAKVANSNPDIELQLLGDGPVKTALMRQIQSLGIIDKVRFFPWSDEVSQVFGQADVLCLASNHEGFGMVLIEGMAASLPILTTDVGCAGDWIVDGEQGIVVPVGSENAYATALQELTDHPGLRERLGKSGHVTTVQRMSTPTEYLHAIQTSFTV